MRFIVYLAVRYFLILPFLFSFSPDSRAEEHVLFTSLGQVDDWETYNHVVSTLKQGDTLRFSNGSVFTVVEILGGRVQNIVIDVGEGRAIRIPRLIMPIKTLNGGTASIEGYKEGYLELKRHGIPAVDVFLDRSLIPEYVMMQKVEFDFRLDELLFGTIKVDEDKKVKALAELISFAKTTWRLSVIGDFDETQLVYTKNGWILLDWGPQFREATQVWGHIWHAFERTSIPMDSELRKKIHSALLIERLKHAPYFVCKALRNALRSGN